MDELDRIRGQLLGIQAQAEAALRSVEALMAKVRTETEKVVEEAEGPRVRMFGSDDP